MAQNKSEAPDRRTQPLEWAQSQSSLQQRVEVVIRQQLIKADPDFSKAYLMRIKQQTRFGVFKAEEDHNG